MAMGKRIARLFVLKTRTEVWLVIYAIALGAVERGRHYMDVYPGWPGIVLALACTGVVFLAGAKLLDSVKPAETARRPARVPAPRRIRHSLSYNRPRARPKAPGSGVSASLRTD